MVEFGDLISAVGKFGLYQKLVVLLLSLPLLLNPFQMVGQVFMVVDVPHYCNTDWIRAVGPNLTEEEQLNLTLPRDVDGEYEQCSMYSPVDWDLDSIMAYGLNATEKCSNGWVYPTAQQPSLLTEFDLVCDRKDLRDTNTYLELLPGEIIHNDDTESSLFFPATEWVGVSYRPTAVLITHCFLAAGQLVLAGLSYGIRNWRLLQIAGSAPMFALFFYFWVLPESARWLVTRGKIEEAKKYLKKAASINKRTIPPELLDQVQQCMPCRPQRPASLIFLKKKNSMKTQLITYSIPLNFRFMDSLVYYGLSLNVTGFGLDIYLTQLAFGVVELPGRICCIYLLQWFGRKKVQAALLLLAGLMCLIIVSIPEDQAVAITVLAVIGKFAACASFSTSYVYSAELFPTIIRQSGVGLCSMAARVAGIIAPLIRLLEQYHRAIPMAVYGSATVLGGLLCFLLPETRGVELPDDTVTDNPQKKERYLKMLGKQGMNRQQKNEALLETGLADDQQTHHSQSEAEEICVTAFGEDARGTVLESQSVVPGCASPP
uniref:Solute carrier family 22 member 13 n=1 Tax=Meleagris gallopavo TaxID=9103 RepID=A0A803YM54_MELGA